MSDLWPIHIMQSFYFKFLRLKAGCLCYRISWTPLWPITWDWIFALQPTLPPLRRSSRSTRRLVWPSHRQWGPHRALLLNLTNNTYRAFIHYFHYCAPLFDLCTVCWPKLGDFNFSVILEEEDLLVYFVEQWSTWLEDYICTVYVQVCNL